MDNLENSKSNMDSNLVEKFLRKKLQNMKLDGDYLLTKNQVKTCKFCNILTKEEKMFTKKEHTVHEEQILFSDDSNMIIKDIRPAAENHLLVIPKVILK